MKQISAKIVVSLAIFASSTSAAKVRAVDSTLTSATEVVQQAYEKKLISTNVRKALNNASLLLEAAHSAGLPWSMSDAHHVILDSTAAFEQSLALRKDEPEETYEGTSRFELDDGDKQDYMAEAVTATGELAATWILDGKPPSKDEWFGLTSGLVVGAIGLYNPVLGAVAGIAFSFFGSLLGFGGEDPNQVLYEKIMKEVGAMVEKSHMLAQVGNAEADLAALLDELQWMPAMLGGICDAQTCDAKKAIAEPTKDMARTLLVYDLMIQHDLAKMSYKIRHNKFGKAESTGLTKEWAASMWPIIGQIYILQINLIMDIGMHEAVGNPMAARSRVLQLLSEWQTFIGNNQQKALEGALAGLQSRLYWSRTSKKDCPSYNPRCKDYKNTQKGKCELDACEKMNCVNMGQTWKCRTRVTKCNPSGSKQVCESSQMSSYFNTYVQGGIKELEGSVDKLFQDFSGASHRRRRSSHRRRRSRRRRTTTTTTTRCWHPRMGCM